MVPFCSFNKNPPVSKDSLGEIATDHSLSTNQKAHLYNQELAKQLNNKPHEQIERFNNALIVKEQDQIKQDLSEHKSESVPFPQEEPSSSPFHEGENDLVESNKKMNKSYYLRTGYPYRVLDTNVTQRVKKLKKRKLNLNKSKLNKTLAHETGSLMQLPLTSLDAQLSQMSNFDSVQSRESSSAGKIVKPKQRSSTKQNRFEPYPYV